MTAQRTISGAVLLVGMLGVASSCICISRDNPSYRQAGQRNSYGSGDDADLQMGSPPSFTDNGDGTITDQRTGLMWEKKQNRITDRSATCMNGASCPNPHESRNTYTWSAEDAVAFEGTAVSVFLAQLNAGTGFAGHTDWRLPSVNELQTLVNYGLSIPATDSAFNTGCEPSCTLTAVNACSCTASAGYWSSTTVANGEGGAWVVNFEDGSVCVYDKQAVTFARGVRGGPRRRVQKTALAPRID